MLTGEVICRMTDRDKTTYIDELQSIIHAQSRYIGDQRILIESLTDIALQLKSLINVASHCAEAGRMLTEQESKYTQKYGRPLAPNTDGGKGKR